MRWYQRWLARAGLHFPALEREEAFREFYVERHVNLMQAFLLGGAILSTASVFWHETIDPVRAPGTHWIKLAVLPLLLLPQALLFLPALRRHAEKLVILPPMTALLAQIFFIMPALEGGMAYTAHPTMQTMLFFIAFMRARYLYVVFVSDSLCRCASLRAGGRAPVSGAQCPLRLGHGRSGDVGRLLAGAPAPAPVR